MGILSFDENVAVDYVPEYGENRKTPDPCVVAIKFIPFKTARELEKARAALLGGVHKQDRVMEINQNSQRDQFIRHVGNVRNYQVGERLVTDVAEFYDTAPTELISELLLVMTDAFRLSQGQLINFRPASV